MKRRSREGSSTGSTSQPEVIGSSPKESSRGTPVHRCSERAQWLRKERYIYVAAEWIGKGCHEQKKSTAFVHTKSLRSLRRPLHRPFKRIFFPSPAISLSIFSFFLFPLISVSRKEFFISFPFFCEILAFETYYFFRFQAGISGARRFPFEVRIKTHDCCN